MASKNAQWILIPGAWAIGPDVWVKTMQAFNERMIIAHAPSLPKSSAEDIRIASIEYYVQRCIQQLSGKLTSERTTWILAHSAGGTLVPELVRQLAQIQVPVHGIVLASAFAPLGGQSVIDLRPSLTEEQRVGIRASMAAKPAEQRFLPVPQGESLKELYLEELSDEESALLSTALVPEPFVPLNTHVDYGQIAQQISINYVLCENDRSLPLERQLVMLKSLRDIGKTGSEIRITSGHNILLSHPQELVNACLSFSTHSSQVSRRWWQLFSR